MNKDKSFRIKYSVHCQCENFFGKETIVRNVMNELQAKVELRSWLEKKYNEFEEVRIQGCEELDIKWTENINNFDDLMNIFKTK